jgi:hypothetical protein
MANRNIFPESQGVAQIVLVPAPFQGLNTRDSYNILRPDEARVLENFLPDNGSCNIRPGYQVHCAAGITFRSTFVHHASQGRSVLAGGNNAVYDVTGTSPIQISTTTITNDRWNTENMGGKIIGVNGTDTPWIYDGTTFAATTFTSDSISISKLSTVQLVRDRLWFTAKNSADVYYGNPSAVGGQLHVFPLSQTATGGQCVDINSWSMATGGEGPSDTTVFVMSTGEILVYSGNPGLGLGDATGFQLVARFNSVPPITSSFGCTVKVGGELVVCTQNGPLPMSLIAQGFAYDETKLGPWGKIAPSWKSDYQRYGFNDGWSATYHAGIVYFNVITGNSQTKQYIFNTRVPAWTTYTGMPVAQFASTGTDLYFPEIQGSNVCIHKGGTDNGQRIIATARQGFFNPALDGNAGGNSKAFTSIRPNVKADGLVEGQFQVDTDFDESPIDTVIYGMTIGTGITPWGSPWGSLWSSKLNVVKRWHGLHKMGVSVSPVIRLYSSADNVQWQSCELRAIIARVT